MNQLSGASSVEPGRDCVLVIDDDPTARDLITDHLQQDGFAVITATGGLEGLKRAKEYDPIAITLDVMMPDLDGWTVLAAMRSDPELAEIPVVMVDHRRRATTWDGAWGRRISYEADRPRQACPSDATIYGTTRGQPGCSWSRTMRCSASAFAPGSNPQQWMPCGG